MKAPIEIFFRPSPKNLPEQKLLDPRKKFWTSAKKFDQRKSIFDPRNPRKKRFDQRNPRNPRKNLTHATHAPT